jgi:hypothetical protein
MHWHDVHVVGGQEAMNQDFSRNLEQKCETPELYCEPHDGQRHKDYLKRTELGYEHKKSEERPWHHVVNRSKTVETT